MTNLTNRKIILQQRPQGEIRDGDLVMEQEPVRDIRDGEGHTHQRRRSHIDVHSNDTRKFRRGGG